MLTRDDLLSSLDRDMRAFAEVLRTVDLSLDVPDCPGWTIADLGRHLAEVHSWAYGIVATGSPGEPDEITTDPTALSAAYRDQAARLLDALRTTDPAAPVWTMGPPPREASFWVRRQAHETGMHLGDALRALDLDVHIDVDVAADGVDEVVTVFFPRQVRLERIPPLAQGIRIELTDVPGTAYVVAGDGTDPDASTVATVRGSAADVLLALWHRGGIERLDVDGDGIAVLSAFATALTP
ncbi:MAG: maleylpyruvate isomerase family mycothiol-dependent enzyme [Candidatus Nanopelagicales bacterium]